MAALNSARLADFHDITYKQFPLKGSATAYKGGACAADTSVGTVSPASNAANQLVIGQFAQDVDNSANTGTSYVTVRLAREIRCYYYDNVTGANAVVASNLFANCYVLDDHTVTMSSAGSAVIAGRVWAIDAELGVLVQHNQF